MSMAPQHNPHMKYNNQHDHGYILLSLSPEEAVAQFKVMATIREKNKIKNVDKIAKVKSGAHDLSIESINQ